MLVVMVVVTMDVMVVVKFVVTFYCLNLKTDIVFEVTSPLEPYAKVGNFLNLWFRSYR